MNCELMMIGEEAYGLFSDRISSKCLKRRQGLPSITAGCPSFSNKYLQPCGQLLTLNVGRTKDSPLVKQYTYWTIIFTFVRSNTGFVQQILSKAT